jgi:hypothetical protein
MIQKKFLPYKITMAHLVKIFQEFNGEKMYSFLLSCAVQLIYTIIRYFKIHFNTILSFTFVSRDSAVGIATSYWLDD